MNVSLIKVRWVGVQKTREEVPSRRVLTPARFSLCWLVKNQEVDLVVVGSRGLSGLRRAIFKSIRFAHMLATPPSSAQHFHHSSWVSFLAPPCRLFKRAMSLV